jgi:hypothetical protein
MNRSSHALVGLVAAVLASTAGADVPTDREDYERRVRMLMQQQEEARREQARQRCEANRGVDCDTEEGLREWLLYDRTREEAVLDIVRQPGGASFGGVPAR